ncbi:MAG: Unknown protein [uncultured Sulfurovum sp.]|uniref:Phosphate ABC transporter substrate-binding protein n=1 Tax=uncultured Sulfurovum sp. TaxID=269237 RepID=A0A6S6TU74_9BACT|nr:MAG: Unknown protein [uncultured Sulfurovum sp.]
MKIIVLLVLLKSLAFSEIIIMTSTKNKLLKVTKKELTDIYLKKKSTIQGISVIPIDNRKNYEEFCRKVINKTPKQMRAYWARELFRGTKKPPKIQNDKQIKNTLQKNKQIISYASSKLTGKIILQISK